MADENGCENCSDFTKRILVTGGAGFIGSHVVLKLVKRYPKYYVVNLDKLEYCASEKHLESIEDAPNYKFVVGDIAEVDFMHYLMRSEKIDTVIHCAAQTHVDLSFASSLEFTKTNVYGTHVLIDCAYKNDVKTFIHVSTDEVYGGESKVKLTESSPLKPTNPYAATKAAAECIVQSYWVSFQFPIIITRSNNVYGPHQYPEKVIPKFISRLNRDMKCCIYGEGAEVRNFIHAQDVSEALITVMHKGQYGEVYNIGTDFELSIIDLAKELIKKIKGVTTEEEVNGWLEWVEDRHINDFRYPLDCTQMKALDWKQTVQFKEGLQNTIDWYTTPGNFESWPGGEQMLVPHAHGLLHAATPRGRQAKKSTTKQPNGYVVE